MAKKSSRKWLDFEPDGTLMIDWDEAVRKAIHFDQGQRNCDVCTAKALVHVQRMSFERGYEAGFNSKTEQEYLLSTTMGNA